MYDHIGLKVNDIGTSVRFYEAALKPLGHEVGSRDESSAGLGPAGAPALWLTLDKGSAGAARMSRFVHPIAQRWIDSIARGLKAADATTARQGCARTTARPTTRRSCSIRTATT